MKSRSRRIHHAPPRVGSTRWFRRYRVFVVLGWLLVLAAGAWLLFSPPSGRVASRGESPVATVAVEPKAKTVAVATPASVASAPAAAVKAAVDDAPHGSAFEGWYSMGHLQAESGEVFSFWVTTLLRPGATVFQGALLDHQSGKQYTDQLKLDGAAAARGGEGFAFSSVAWQFSGAGPGQAVKVAGKEFSLDLTMRDTQAPVVHGAAGALVVKALGKSSYVSRPRLQAAGTVSVGGVSRSVRGEVWFDHQWGDFDPAGVRWNRFALQLEKGAELMVYEVLDAKGAARLRVGSYVQAGVVTALGAADFKATARGTWTSSSSVVYPMDWTITVPGKGVEVKLEPVIRRSQFNARASTSSVYWKGAVKVSGSSGGVGFAELQGYPVVAPVVGKGKKR